MNFLQIIIVVTFLFDNWIHSNPVSEFDESLEIIESNEADLINHSSGVIELVETLLKWKFDPTKLGMDPYERIKYFGYPSEKHIVMTQDGYILTMNRIPYGISSTERKNRPVVFLQPGLLCTPAIYIDIGPQHSLAYLLANRGYDVWLGSVRGTTFCRNHTTLDSMKDKQFWNYSWHEVGTFDIPAMIDYILKTTGRQKISYIGHSQGTTAYFVMGAERPEYNDKINVMIALAPVVFMEHIDKNSTVYLLARRRKQIFSTLKILGISNVLPHYDPYTKNVQKICNPNTTDWSMCQKFVESQMGEWNPEMFDLRNSYYISEHFPGGASLKQYEHYAQLISDGGFKQFNYGKKKNIRIYGQSEPPPYNVSIINTPVYLMYGDNDSDTPIQDLRTLHALLPNSKLFRIDYPLFNHGDFIYGTKVIPLVYDYVFEFLKKHQ